MFKGRSPEDKAKGRWGRQNGGEERLTGRQCSQSSYLENAGNQDGKAAR